jgi:hypothetical protein
MVDHLDMFGGRLEEYLDAVFLWDAAEEVQSDTPEAERRFELLNGLPTPRLASLLTLAFSEPQFMLKRYTGDQIAKGIWYVFWCSTDFSIKIMENTSGTDVQSPFLMAIGSLYSNVFDKLCGVSGSRPDDNFIDDIEIDGAAFILWDLGGMMRPLYCRSAYAPHVYELWFDVVTEILMNCRTSACRMGALHALGHARVLAETHDPPRVASICETISAFIREKQPVDWVRDYALRAQSEFIQ